MGTVMNSPITGINRRKEMIYIKEVQVQRELSAQGHADAIRATLQQMDVSNSIKSEVGHALSQLEIYERLIFDLTEDYKKEISRLNREEVLAQTKISANTEVPKGEVWIITENQKVIIKNVQ